jgi:hypothetical protein
MIGEHRFHLESGVIGNDGDTLGQGETPLLGLSPII